MSAIRQFNLRAVTNLTGVNEHTLRAWERRYALVQPARSPTGRRVYTESDVRRVGLVAQLVQRGHAVSQLAPLADAVLAELLDASLATEAPRASSPANGAAVAALEDMVARFDLCALHEELTVQRAGLGARGFALGLVVPLMGLVGRHVAAERFSIAQEHALTSIVRAHLMDALYSVSRRDTTGRPWRVALTTIEGDQHELGILTAAVVCADLGATVSYLGASLPPSALAQAAHALTVDCVILGGSEIPASLLAWTPEAYVATVVQELARLRRGRRSRLAVWVGGSLARATFTTPVTRVATLRELDGAIEVLELAPHVRASSAR